MANSQSVQRERDERFQGRARFGHPPSSSLAAYIRNHTAVDARVLSPHPTEISAVTGRPNASGFADRQHLFPEEGPSYRDAIQHLEPAAIRRLGIGYVHATDAWVTELPDRARRWLADPGLFDLLIRDGTDALYQVRPLFLRLDPAPAPASFEALRQAVPPATTLYLSPTLEQVGSLRVASVLSHARLLSVVDPGPINHELEYSLATPYARLPGFVKRGPLHMLAPWPAEPMGDGVPDLVVTPAQLVPWMLPPARRQPIWWNREVAVYAPHGAVAPIMPPPPRKQAPDVGVRADDLRAADGRVTFAVTLNDRAPRQWSGQDWVLIAVDSSPWGFPLARLPDGRLPEIDAWFAGQIVPGRGTTTRAYAFDAGASSLAVRDGNGAFIAAASSGGLAGPGTWTLALRLIGSVDRGAYVTHEEAALIPVLTVRISAAGEASYAIHDDLRDE